MATPGNKKPTASGDSRTSARNKGQSVTVEELEEIQDASKARKFLENKGFITLPPGTDINALTYGQVSATLHAITALAGIPKQAHNAIRSVAYLIDELEELALHALVHDTLKAAMNDITKDLGNLVEDYTKKIDEHTTLKLNEISQATKTLIETSEGLPNPSTGYQNTTYNPIDNSPYKKALLSAPPNVNPRLAAKESIRTRQFLLEGITRESRLARMSAAELKTEVNKALEQGEAGEFKARSVTYQNKLNILIEMETAEGAAWLRNERNGNMFRQALGDGVEFKKRLYSVIAFNVDTAFNPDSTAHMEEVKEANGYTDKQLVGARWVKPIGRRENPRQATAHLILKFGDVDEANRTIVTGPTIFQRKKKASKCKKEPIRCMKCQRWNHLAHECLSKEDTCGTCGETGHWSKHCTNKGSYHCVSCDDDDHASWSRECPTFLRKCAEMDERTPENALPFFPSTEPWTWSTEAPPLNKIQKGNMRQAEWAEPPPFSEKGRNQKERRERGGQAPAGRPYQRTGWRQPSQQKEKSTSRETPPAEPHTAANAASGELTDDQHSTLSYAS